MANHDTTVQSRTSDDFENKMEVVLRVAPLVNLMEPQLVGVLTSILRTRNIDHLNAVVKVARKHSMLRLPIRKTLPPPRPRTDPFVFGGHGELVLQDPSVCFLEEMEHLAGLHPSVLMGEYSSIACKDTWFDFEVQHGDCSNASPSFVPLAWLAAKLAEISVRQSLVTPEDDKAICCEAVQLLDECTPDGVPFPARFSVLREPLLKLAREAEEACLRPASDSDAEQYKANPEEEMSSHELVVKVLQYSRHPQSLRDALRMESRWLTIGKRCAIVV